MKTAVPKVQWSAAERRAWTPPEVLQPAEWAEKHRRLTRRQSARPGPWRNAAAPYLVGMMDLFTRRDVEMVTIVKAAQIGVSEALRNVVGYFAAQEPDPILLVLPSEETGRKIVAKRIIPLLRDTACLRELFTTRAHDLQLRNITLANGFVLSLGWSGSPSTLASDPARVVINDEVDKFVEWSGRESDPVRLAYMRTQTYEDRRKICNISTPTTRAGMIWQLYEAAEIKLAYYVPCPHCGRYQRLTFDRLHWEKFGDDASTPTQQAALIVKNRAAWIKCIACGERIEERHKAEIVNRGVWAVEDVKDDLAELARDVPAGGIVSTGWPAGKRVGMQISALYCLWVPFWDVAAEFVRSRDELQGLMNFRNSWLGQPFEQQVTRAKESVFAMKSRGAEAPQAGIVPAWASCLLATADVQKDCFYWVARAWGYGFRSQRVAHGICHTFEELRENCLESIYPSQENKRFTVAPRLLGIDSGYRTHEVYAFAASDPARIKPLKGESESKDRPLRLRKVSYTSPEEKRSSRRQRARAARLEVWLHFIDTSYFKDMLAAKVTQSAEAVNMETGELTGESVEAWQLDGDNDEDYNRQLAAEHKVLVREGRKTPREKWIKVTAGAANHYLDCEVYQLALAHIARVDLLRPPRAPQQPKKPRPTDDERKKLPRRHPIRWTY